MDELTAWSRDLTVEVGGHGVVSHTGSAALRMLADRTGLTRALSRALYRRGFIPVHDRGPGAGRHRGAARRRRPGDVGPGSLARSDTSCSGRWPRIPTLWRALEEIGPDQRDRIAAARAKVRRHVWGLIEARHGRIPASRVADRDLGDTIVIRMDATIQIAHSDKQQAAGTFKGTWGHHSLTAWCDNTSESLALRLRPGNAGSNTAVDHIEVLDEAIVQIPARYRRNLLITCDGAGATLDLVKHVSTLNTAPGRRVHYSVGFDLDHRGRTAINQLSDTDWDQVLDHRGNPRDLDDAGVVELTGLLRRSVGGDRLANWPADMRIMCRRERPSSGAQLSLMEEADGWRYQLVATNTPTGHAQFLEARHRPHARVEDRIRTGKNTGIGHLPSKSYALNQAWCVAAAIGCDLLCWLRLLCLDGPLAKAEPKTLRYRLLHTAARLVRGQRKRKIKIPESWPWARELEACFLAIFALPAPT